MFFYRPSKEMLWGNALRRPEADWRIVRQRMEGFLPIYFEILESHNDLEFTLRWKDASLPNIAWPAEYVGPENQESQQVWFCFSCDRVSFPLGFPIPVSPDDPSSYEFIGRFNASAPFKMNTKHFRVVMRVGKKGTLVDRKPDAAITRRLNDALSGKRTTT